MSTNTTTIIDLNTGVDLGTGRVEVVGGYSIVERQVKHGTGMDVVFSITTARRESAPRIADYITGPIYLIEQSVRHYVVKGVMTPVDTDRDAIIDNSTHGCHQRWSDGLKFVPDCQYWAVRTQDNRYYLDENGKGWMLMPQAMGGWFLSLDSAKKAANQAGPPPGWEAKK